MNTHYYDPPMATCLRGADPLPKTDTVLTLLREQKDAEEHAEIIAELGRIYARCLVRDAVFAEASAAEDAHAEKLRAANIETVTAFLAGKVAEHGEAAIGYVETAIHQLGYREFSPATRVAYESLSASARRAVNGKLLKAWRVEHLYPEWRAFLKELP